MNNLRNLAPSEPRVTITRVKHIALTDNQPDPHCRIVRIKPRGFFSRLCYAPKMFASLRRSPIFRRNAARRTIRYILGKAA